MFTRNLNKMVMRPLAQIVVIFVLVSVLLRYPADANQSLPALYESKKPTFAQKAGIMYTKGYFHFLYTAAGEAHLQLNEDSTFTYSETFCNTGRQVMTGRWSVKDNTLNLQFDDADYSERSFVIKGTSLYEIKEVTLVESNKKIKALTLLEKVE